MLRLKNKSIKKFLERIRASVKKIFLPEEESKKNIPLDSLKKLRNIIKDQEFVVTNG